MNATREVPDSVQASWGYVVEVKDVFDSPEIWPRAMEMVELGILLGFDRVRRTLTFPERTSNHHFVTLYRWVLGGVGPRPNHPDGFNDDFVSPFREESSCYSPPGELQRTVISEQHHGEQALVRARALEALGIVFNVDAATWSYDIPISPLTNEGALAVWQWVNEGGSRPNFAAMCYNSVV